MKIVLLRVAFATIPTGYALLTKPLLMSHRLITITFLSHYLGAHFFVLWVDQSMKQLQMDDKLKWKIYF